MYHIVTALPGQSHSQVSMWAEAAEPVSSHQFCRGFWRKGTIVIVTIYFGVVAGYEDCLFLAIYAIVALLPKLPGPHVQP